MKTQKSKAKSLLTQIYSLQRKIYNFQSELEDAAEKSKDDTKKDILNAFSEMAGCSGFELDESARHMENIVNY